MRLLVIFTLLLYYNNIFSQSHADSVKYKIEIQSVDAIQKLFDTQDKLINQSNDSIANELSAANFNLTLFAVLFGLGTVFLTLFVTIMYNRAVKLREINNTLVEENRQIKADVVELNQKIHRDLSSLYIKLRREETEHMLDMLIKNPKTVLNMQNVLLTRELEQSDFQKLKKAYLKTKDLICMDAYQLLFFQHFLDQSLKDEQLRKPIATYMPSGIQCAFENDIQKNMIDFGQLLTDRPVKDYVNELNTFFTAISTSQFGDFEEAYNDFFEALATREKRFEVYSLLENTSANRRSKVHIGDLLERKYASQNPNTEELKMLESVRLFKHLLDEEIAVANERNNSQENT